MFFLIAAIYLGVGVPGDEIAGTLLASYLPRPEWYFMWLFQLLTFFPGRYEAVGSLAVPALAVALLFGLPFLGRARAAGPRPLALATGVALTVAIVFLSLGGFESARPYGEIVPVPASGLTPKQARGLALFVERDCAYCHQIGGRGGHRTGPDMANMALKRRGADYLAKFVKDPQAVQPTSIMPKYELPEADAGSLAAFLLALDLDKDWKLMRREEITAGKIALAQEPGANPAEAARQ